MRNSDRVLGSAILRTGPFGQAERLLRDAAKRMKLTRASGIILAFVLMESGPNSPKPQLTFRKHMLLVMAKVTQSVDNYALATRKIGKTLLRSRARRSL